MNTLGAQTALILADNWDGRYGPGWGPGPWFFLIPLTFWIAVIVIVVLARRRWRGRHGESTLRDVYAHGEITEAEYRARLAVLRETRR
ncbi:hypothetical protein FK531_05490 [Rhodococcus spelaei]|uniref:SHOCT domain-containing protein n=1 Tax=Rhodococcus spelaei TaxID=2546320 RepID=A0A541BP68_9NOCA|nr:hypothetical protein [Rhodococcus spelaei]TQF74106.1 hypothetical protein FK531_05490 [Rhodococcus spelaei]